MKQAHCELTAAARADLLDIWIFPAEWETLDIADKVLADLEKAMERLVEEPHIGHPRRDLTRRKLPFYRVHSYPIIYRKEKVPSHAARVLHAARDANEALGE